MAQLRVNERTEREKISLPSPIKNSYFKYAISLDYLFKASTFLRIELYLDSEELTLHIFEFRVNILRFISRKGVEFIVEIRRRE